MLFLGAGVNWLCKGQAADAVGQKSVAKNLSAAALFGVEQILVDAQACAQYGLEFDDLLSGSMPSESISETLSQFSRVVFAG